MKNNKLVYKLYEDVQTKPTKDLFIKPLLVGTGFAIGTLGSYFVDNDNLMLILAASGLTGFFLLVKALVIYQSIKSKKIIMNYN